MLNDEARSCYCARCFSTEIAVAMHLFTMKCGLMLSKAADVLALMISGGLHCKISIRRLFAWTDAGCWS
ncbi:unnamed protein product [Citrullus colocynthis]|uniref:Uncharacterized protein n=1 Tax=Citrullus colocynthis TaxID=252529 RepID=A0ABP0YD38_9ROSI